MPEKRLQSPSSINTYKQCPRKYYYSYIQKLPQTPNIHLVRGRIVHQVLEDFFDVDINDVTLANYKDILRKNAQQLLLAEWTKNRKDVKQHTDNPDQERFYFSESLLMILNWVEQFFKKVESFTDHSFQDIFKKLTPLREKEYRCYDLYVRGFIDAIEHHGDEVHIMDYKTNTRLEINEEQQLQLAIYALLYRQTHGKIPEKAGIYFLRSKPKRIAITQELLDLAEREITYIHEQTQKSKIEEYPLKPGPLCKWCNFYKICFEQKTIKDYVSAVQEAKQEQVLQK